MSLSSSSVWLAHQEYSSHDSEHHDKDDLGPGSNGKTYGGDGSGQKRHQHHALAAKHTSDIATDDGREEEADVETVENETLKLR